MAVANGTVAEFTSWGVTTPVSIEFTPVNAARGIVVGSVINGAVDDQFTGITVEGVAMSRVDFAVDSSGETGRAEIWFLAGLFPAGIAQTVQITTTGGAGTKWASVASVTALSNPQIATSSKLEGDVANPQIALDTGTVSTLRMAIIFSGHDAAATLVRVTGMVAPIAATEHDFGTTVAKLGRQSSWSEDFTIGWTAASEDVAMVAIAIQEAAGGILPFVVLGQAGHVDHHNLIHDDLNGLTSYPASSDGPLAAFYNAIMSYYDGARSTPFFGVNVQHPDFGATGINSQATENDAPALNAAVEFATKNGTVTGRVWIPALSILGNGARYYLDSPFKVFQGAYISAYGAEVAPTTRFDFTTYFPADPGWGTPPGWTAQQGLVEGYNPPANVDGRLALGRYSMEGLLVTNNLNIHDSIGLRFNAQQDSNFTSVWSNNMYKYGWVLTGQQAHFWSCQAIGPDPALCTSADLAVGIRLGNDLGDPADTAASTASMMYFWGLTTHGCRTHIQVANGTPYKTSINNLHIEARDWGITPEEAWDAISLEDGVIEVDGIDASMARYSTLLHIPDTVAGGNTGADLRAMFLNGASPTSTPSGVDTLLLNDEFRGHSIKAWGNTKLATGGEEGGVRYVDHLMIPTGSDGGHPRMHVSTIIHDEGGYTAFGSYNSETVDAEQQPLFRMRPGATQMGHLASWYDKSGVERYLITADGMPKLPGYTAATKPSAVGRESIMIYDLDTNKVQVSDGSAWVSLH